MNAIKDANQFRVLIPEDRLQARIQELGAKIRSDYGGRPIVCICVLKGSFMFTADLVRAIGGQIEVEFLGVSSYQGGTKTTGVVKITKDLSSPIEDKDVIIIEDIIDTGLTMHYLLDMLAVRQPRSMSVCTLLDKPGNREVEMSADYVGFSIPDEFVVGYGLDLAERYRNLPHKVRSDFGREPDLLAEEVIVVLEREDGTQIDVKSIPVIGAGTGWNLGPIEIAKNQWGGSNLFAFVDWPDNVDECIEDNNVLNLGTWPCD